MSAATLPWSVLVRLAGRNIGRNPARTMLSLAAIATGVAGLILSGGFVNDLIYQLGETLIHSQSGHIQIAQPGYFDVGSRAPARYLISEEHAQALQRLPAPHVRQAMRRVAFPALLSNGRSSYPVLGEGMEAEQEAQLGTHLLLVQGRSLDSRDRYGAMVGAGVARAMNLKAGSRFSLVTTTVDEAMNTVDLEVVGVFQSFSRDYDDRAVKVTLPAAQELLDTKGVNLIVLVLDETRHTNQVVRTLAEKLMPLGLEARTWERVNDFYWKTVALYDRQFGVLRLIVLLMVVVAVVGAINVGVFERLGEFGTMRAIGNTGWDVLRLVMLEGVVLGVLGGMIGAAFGIALAYIISAIGIPMPPPPNSNLEFVARIRVVPSVVMTAFAVGFLATVLSSIPAALRARRLPIIEALRRLA